MVVRNQLEHAINETEKPLMVNSDCIYKREGRMGIDRVKDTVEHNLHSEVDNIRNVQNQMKDTLNGVSIRIRILVFNFNLGWGGRVVCTIIFMSSPAKELMLHCVVWSISSCISTFPGGWVGGGGWGGVGGNNQT